MATTVDLVQIVLLAAQLVVLLLSLLGFTVRLPSEASSRRKRILQLRLTDKMFGELYAHLQGDLGESRQLLLMAISFTPLLLLLLPASGANPWLILLDSIWVSCVIWGMILLYFRLEFKELSKILNRKRITKADRRTVSFRYQSTWAVTALWSTLLFTLFGISASVAFLGTYPSSFVSAYAATVLATSLGLSIWIYPRAWSLLREIENGAYQQASNASGPLVVECSRKGDPGGGSRVGIGNLVDIGEFCIVLRSDGPDPVPWSEIATLRPIRMTAV